MNMKRKISIMALAAVLAVFSGCNSEDEIVNDEPQKEEQEQPGGESDEPGEENDWSLVPNAISLEGGEQAIINSQNEFAFAVLDKLCDCEGNVFISPLSISMALSMTANGAETEVQREILSAFGFEGDDLASLNALNRKLMCELPNVDNTVKLSLANSVWVDNSFHVYDTFVSNVKENYKAEIRNVDFESPTTVGMINAWCSEKTSGMIPQMVDRLDEKSSLAIFNAVYFKAPWQFKFDEKDTYKEYFRNADGSVVKSDMMHKVIGNYENYAETSDCRVLAFPYGSCMPNMGVELFVMLPKNDSENYPENISALKFRKQMVNLTMPKFELDYVCSENLRGALKQLGINRLFEAVVFPGISGNELSLSEICQKSKIVVDEKGSEASAVSGMIGVTSDGDDEKQDVIDFKINRPFRFVIREESTGAILFMGKVNNL